MQTRIATTVALIAAFAGCSTETADTQIPVKVEIIRTESGYQLTRGGELYEIRGAGLEYGNMQSLAAHSGNSFRTWRTDNARYTAQEVLDRAQANGLTVALCLPMQPERAGFDYDDAAAVAAQLAKFRDEVEAYRNHPALLMWMIGNELNHSYTNSSVYDAVNDVAKMIHELDPNHPTTTTLAGFNQDVVKDVEKRAPDIDILSIQVYGDLFVLPELIAKSDFKKPFLVTEWGAIGHWEVGKTRWGAPIEATSSEKADNYLRGHREMLESMQDQLVGSYVFLWGQKQERTPTWYGMFTEVGEETETVDVMHFLWNGEWPLNRSPRLNSMRLDGKSSHDNISLQAGEQYSAAADVFDHDGDTVTYRWELKPESDSTKEGGDYEAPIINLEGLIEDDNRAEIQFMAPESGTYRLFVYAYDGHNHAAHANIPFIVSPATDQQ